MVILTFLLALLVAIITAAFILAEIFFIPGVGLLGILSVGGFIGIEVYLIGCGETALAITYAILTITAFVAGFYYLSRNKFIKKVELTETVDEVAVKLPTEIVVGNKGIADSRLALVGTIRIDKELLIEAESEEGFINEGEAVYISNIRNNKVFVKRDRNANN